MATGRLPRIDLVGQRFERLLVLFESERRGAHRYWFCQCDCGNEKVVRHGHLLSGRTRSCGCLCTIGLGRRQHGNPYLGPKTHTYKIWSGLIKRCYDAKAENFHLYGGRGITVCERWHSFEAFLTDMGERPSKELTIERLDNERGYEPGNCAWRTKKDQANNRRSSRIIEWNGERRTLQQWAEATGISSSAISSRIDGLGWTVQQALTTPGRTYEKRFIEFRGERRTIEGWATHLGIHPATLRGRLRRGLTAEEALTSPIGSFPNRK